MEVETFYIRLLITAFIHLGSNPQRVNAAFTIIPTKLQLFEYESFSLNCFGFDAFTECSVQRSNKRGISTCGFSNWGVNTKWSCIIRSAFMEDSGEYWCEAGGGERSHSVNVSVSAGSVVLESPVHPVMEGESVTLRCRNKTTPSNHPADFYKNGVLIGSSSTQELMIDSISTCDKGFYKCKISDDSPESWLAVRESHQEIHTSSDLLFVIFRNLLPVVMMALLLLLLGRLHFGKLRGSRFRTPNFDCVKMRRRRSANLHGRVF